MEIADMINELQDSADKMLLYVKVEAVQSQNLISKFLLIRKIEKKLQHKFDFINTMIQMLLELEDYRSIGTVDEFRVFKPEAIKPEAFVPLK